MTRRALGGFLLLASMTACQAAPAVPTLTATPSAPAPTATLQAPPTSAPLPGLQGQVNLWLAWEPDEIEALGRAIEAFLLLNPDVRVRVVYHRPDELRQAFEASVGVADGPTVLFGPDIWGPALWSGSRIQDLAELFAPGLEEGLRPAALSQIRFGAAVLGLPLEMQGVVLYVDRLRMPEQPTFHDLIAPAPPDAGYVRGLPDFGLAVSGAFLSVCGATLSDALGAPAFAVEGGRCWLDLLERLSAAGPITYGTEQDLIRFEAGESAWIMEGSWNRERLQESLGPARLGIAPWPPMSEGGNRLAGFVWTENAYIASGLDPADLAANWEFIRYLLTPAVQSALADPLAGGRLPTVSDAVVEDPLMAQAVNALEAGLPFPLQADLSIYSGPLERSIRAYLLHSAPDSYLLRRAAEEIRSLQGTPSP